MTPTDSPNGYKADLQVMRQDAKRWDQTSDQLGQAASTASSLNLDDAKFSIIGSATGLIGTYDNFRSWIADLLNDGKATYADLSATLERAAQTYEEQEKATAGKIHQIDVEGN